MRPHWSLPLVLAGVGAISGAISFGAVFFLGAHGMGEQGAGILIPASPGLVFGVLVGFTIASRHYGGSGNYLGFVAVSTLACFVVMYLGIALSVAGTSGRSYYSLERYYRKFWDVGAVCGLLGSAALTAYAYKFLPNPPGRFGAASMVLSGTVLGVALTPLAVGIPIIGLAYLLVGWQCGFAASLGLALAYRVRPGT